MTSLVARASGGLARVMRTVGSALDSAGKFIEVTKYTEKLVPSTQIVAVNGVAPKVSESCFVAPNASVIGDVTIGKGSSVWFGAIVRGDVNTISIGEASSIGDRAVVHVAKIQGDLPTRIGNHVTIGAGAIVHAATLENAIVVGESAQVLDGSVIESFSRIAAASLVVGGTRVKSGELWAGTPAQCIRTLTQDEKARIVALALETSELASEYAEETMKSYQQVLEEEELREQEEVEPFEKEEDSTNVLGQGQPGRIFRSTLSHSEYIQRPEGENSLDQRISEDGKDAGDCTSKDPKATVGPEYKNQVDHKPFIF